MPTPATPHTAPAFTESEMTVAESLQRSKERKKRRADVHLMVVPKGAMACVHQCLSSPAYSDLAKCLLRKMVEHGLIDDCTEPLSIQCIAEHANDLFIATFQCKDGNGFDLIRSNIDSNKYTLISEVLRANYSSLSDCEEKCIYWTMCSAFLIMYYEVHSDLVFNLPLSFTKPDFEKFLRRYPEFLLRTWDAADLLTFQLCMKRAVQCFGNGNNMGCLTELVTRIVKGRDVALTCNTSGGGLRNYDHPTEVSTEKCRILIYQRESGILPRTRKSRGSKRKFCPGDGPVCNINMPIIPGINAPRNTAVDMMPNMPQSYHHSANAPPMAGDNMYHQPYSQQSHRHLQGGPLMYSGNSYGPSQSAYSRNYDMYNSGYGNDNDYGGQMGIESMYSSHPQRSMQGSGMYDMMDNYSYNDIPMQNSMPTMHPHEHTLGVSGGMSRGGMSRGGMPRGGMPGGGMSGGMSDMMGSRIPNNMTNDLHMYPQQQNTGLLHHRNRLSGVSANFHSGMMH